MKDYTVVCSDPFKCHKKKIVNGVFTLPRSVYSICVRYDIDITQNEHICVNCLKKLQYQIHEKRTDTVLEPKMEVLPKPTFELNTSVIDPLVCCDPFKTHKKVIISGVCRLPKTVFFECQRHGINVEEDSSICINCLKKLQYQNKGYYEEQHQNKGYYEEQHQNKGYYEEQHQNKGYYEDAKMAMVKIKECLDPFKSHKKIITSGLCNMPEKLREKCQRLGVDVTDGSHICVNCLKKLQYRNQAKTAPQVYSNGTGYYRASLDSPAWLSSPERDYSFTKEYLDEVAPSLAIGQVEMDGLSPATQITNIISSFRNVTPFQKRKLTCEAYRDSDVNEERLVKKSRKMSKFAASDANMNSSDGPGGRGALIVLEGCDRTGKTTQAHKLVESLKAAGKPATFMRFPDRSTKIGSIIDSYLACSSELEDHSIHLLFSANRWELLPKIMSEIEGGTSIIIDRYAFSGAAFSAAKKGMTLEWCKQSDIGLPKPDLVLFLDLSAEEAQRRAQFGEERYEKADFQKRVDTNYRLLQDESWKVIDANKSIDDLQDELKAEVLKVVDSVGEANMAKLWV